MGNRLLNNKLNQRVCFTLVHIIMVFISNNNFNYYLFIFSVISINGNIMQLSTPPSGGSPTVTQAATTVAQAVPQNQQNIVMVISIHIILFL